MVVQNNRKTVQHLDGGIIREIRVREGVRVKAGEVLMVFDPTQPRASVEVLRNQYDSLIAERARLEAELAGASAVTYPPELLARQGDPRVAGVIRDQNNLFRASLSVYKSQVGVLNQRLEQYRSRLDGLRSQIESLTEQAALINDELQGVTSLQERGFAPRSRLLALQRQSAALTGDRGARIAETAGVQEAMGEARIQLAQLLQQRTTAAAEALRETQARISDVTPRLQAAEEVLERTTVRSPVEGYVLGLTQFTEGGVAAPGSRLLDVVPADAPLVVRVRVRPDQSDDIRPGMTAQVRITAFRARQIQPMDAQVLTVSADQLVDEQFGPYFEAELAIAPSELTKLPEGATLAPGMPAQAMIVTGERTILSYILSPLTDTLRDAMREQ